MNQQMAAQASVLPAVIREGAETADILMRSSLASNTQRAYASALRKLDVALQGQDLTGRTLAAYIGCLAREDLSPASAATVLAAVKRSAEEKGLQSPAGKLSRDALRVGVAVTAVETPRQA